MKVEDTELGDPGERNLLLQSPAGHMVSYIYSYHKKTKNFLRFMSYDYRLLICDFFKFMTFRRKLSFLI